MRCGGRKTRTFCRSSCTAVEGGKIKVRQYFELEGFGLSEAIERFRDIGIGAAPMLSEDQRD